MWTILVSDLKSFFKEHFTTYGKDHEDTQIDKDISIVVGPVRDDLGLLRCQIVAPNPRGKYREAIRSDTKPG